MQEDASDQTVNRLDMSCDLVLLNKLMNGSILCHTRVLLELACMIPVCHTRVLLELACMVPVCHTRVLACMVPVCHTRELACMVPA